MNFYGKFKNMFPKNNTLFLDMRETHSIPLLSDEYNDRFDPLFFKSLNSKNINVGECGKIFCSEVMEDYLVFGNKEGSIFIYNFAHETFTKFKKHNEEGSTYDIKGIRSIKKIGLNKFCYGFQGKLYFVNDFRYDKELEKQLHESWITDINYYDNDIITSSGDKTVKIFNLENKEEKELYKLDSEGEEYIRNFERCNNKLFMLKNSGKYFSFDINKKKIIDYYNPQLHETVCCSYNDEKQIFVIGNKNGIYAKDFREKRKTGINHILIENDVSCIRSIEWYNDNICTIGGRNEKIGVFDIRKGIITTLGIPVGKYVENEAYHYLSYHLADYLDMSIFTHKYINNKRRIFVAGGPTVLGLEGSSVGFLE